MPVVTVAKPDNVPITLEGGSPLARIPDFVNATCPKCGGPARRVHILVMRAHAHPRDPWAAGAIPFASCIHPATRYVSPGGTNPERG